MGEEGGKKRNPDQRWFGYNGKWTFHSERIEYWSNRKSILLVCRFGSIPADLAD